MRRAGTVWLAVGCLVMAVIGAAPAQDTVRVRADGKPLWGEHVRLERELTIGQVDGPPEYAFGEIAYIAIDGTGAIYVFDRHDNQIRRYDSRGEFQNLVGRKGAGPGEYEYPTGMSVLADSLLVVCDPENGRISVFGPDGKLRRNVPWPRGTFGYGGDCAVDAQGRLYRRVPMTAPAAGAEVGLNAPAQFVRLRPSGELIDSLPLGSAETKGRKFVLVGPSGARYSFPDEKVYAPYLRGGAIGGHTVAYRVFIRDDNGQVRVVERPHRPLDLGREERGEWLAYVEHFKQRDGVDLGHRIPTAKPAFRELLSDDTGRIWVHVYVIAEKRPPTPRSPGATGPRLTWRERNTYDVLTPTGAYLGRIPLEHEARLMAIRGDRIYVREKGSEWEDKITVYRLPPTLQ